MKTHKITSRNIMEKIEERILKKCRHIAAAKVDEIMRPALDHWDSATVKVSTASISPQLSFNIGQGLGAIREAFIEDLTTSLANSALDDLVELSIKSKQPFP